MNERLNDLLGRAKVIAEETVNKQISKNAQLDAFAEKFAELIVQECVNQCRQEWYDLNNAVPKENETLRDIGIRVGQKNGVLKTISRIKEHFGVV
ncbi:hypothetical protein UFOVP116_171 [uncultured Caudovirales phage]|uniref:Uncharacterized protein n=1 Tax=uncultured Caudovirales phage TaxID=2100421 RepID=A0A6J5L9B1_9CAUD|nr:hypothetical protein UFOVP116_171 [uncultured Caudovirales phage]